MTSDLTFRKTDNAQCVLLTHLPTTQWGADAWFLLHTSSHHSCGPTSHSSHPHCLCVRHFCFLFNKQWDLTQSLNTCLISSPWIFFHHHKLPPDSKLNDPFFPQWSSLPLSCSCYSLFSQKPRRKIKSHIDSSFLVISFMLGHYYSSLICQITKLHIWQNRQRMLKTQQQEKQTN